MTPRPRAVLLRATNINVLAFPGSAQAYTRFVPRRQPSGPLNAKKVSFERGCFDAFALRTSQLPATVRVRPALKTLLNPARSTNAHRSRLTTRSFVQSGFK